MIEVDKIACVGCSACASVCPREVIKLQRNSEGFLYPVIVNQTNCIECGLCNKSCPVINLKEETKFEQKAAIAQIYDDKIRKESASGGMFSAIALCVLEKGGIVFGAAYDDNFKVKHIAVDSKEELHRLRNSKYVQSDLSGIFVLVKRHLLSNKLVCFSGTPCQIEGLKCFLNKDYPNLILVDVVCHGVSSPLIWDKYLETIDVYKPEDIYFRWKHYGYKYSTMSIFSKNKEVYFSGVESDKMLRAYFSNGCDRETCYKCQFKKRYRESDFTIWDCFQPRYFDKSFDDDKGTSCVLLHTEKAKRWFEEIIDKKMIRYLYVPSEEIVEGNREMVGSVKRNPIRDSILIDAQNLDSNSLFKKYFPDSKKQKIKRFIRITLVKIGLYSFFKYKLFLYRMRKKR